MQVNTNSAGQTFSDSVTLETVACTCGTMFAAPASLIEQRRRDRGTFFCPNGHPLVFTKTESEILRQKLADKDRELNSANARLGFEQEKTKAAQRERDASRKAHQRMRQRVKAGVCPCCKRTFQNLLSHMTTQHPDFGNANDLKSIRVLYGLTQRQLAEEIGISSVYVSAFERGGSMPDWASERIKKWIGT